MTIAADLPAMELGLSPFQATRVYESLQDKLIPLWHSIRTMDYDEQTFVVIPSQTIDFDFQGAEVQGYEERFLFLLLLLRQPQLRMIYVSSKSILPSTIDYYLGLIPNVPPSHARARLHLISPEDGSPRPLTLKILERPNLVENIRCLVKDPNRAHLIPYNTTELERDLAIHLGIPMYGADPKFLPYGTKSGCRRLFAEEDVAFPLGCEDLTCIDDTVEAIAKMRRQKPAMNGVVIKLNEGVSGTGNAIADLRELPAPGCADELDALTERVRGMRFEGPATDYESYTSKFADNGGIVEELIRGEEIRSPSVQLRVTPLGDLELLSTHDQVLGGPSGQLYSGCRFPADSDYASLISKEATKVGRRLAAEGVLGRFSVDFVVVRQPHGEWKVYAIEINLRKGGTTHPFLTLQYLTDGTYDPEKGVFVTPAATKNTTLQAIIFKRHGTEPCDPTTFLKWWLATAYITISLDKLAWCFTCWRRWLKTGVSVP